MSILDWNNVPSVGYMAKNPAGLGVFRILPQISGKGWYLYLDDKLISMFAKMQYAKRAAERMVRNV